MKPLFSTIWIKNLIFDDIKKIHVPLKRMMFLDVIAYLMTLVCWWVDGELELFSDSIIRAYIAQWMDLLYEGSIWGIFKSNGTNQLT